MNSITINDLLINLSEYNPDAISDVKKAYDYASYLHNGQVRQSGDPYISHPLNVAYILSEMHADSDTVCAGLLHDTLEDTIKYAHSIGKKVYVALNIYANDTDYEEVEKQIKILKNVKADAIIASDPGIIMMIKKNNRDFIKYVL